MLVHIYIPVVAGEIKIKATKAAVLYIINIFLSNLTRIKVKVQGASLKQVAVMHMHLH